MSDAIILWSDAPQGSDDWLAVRRGRITGSRAKDTRDTVIVQRARAAKPAKIDRKTGEILDLPQEAEPEIRGPSAKAMLYARDTARERCGGRPQEVYQTAAMRFGSEQEPLARMAYEDTTGELVEQVGFAYTNDGKFGCSVDGLVGTEGMVEIKTLVSSDMLFGVVVEGDYSAYIDQIDMALWLLNLKWCDLCLWAPDLPQGRLTIQRIWRDEDRINALVRDLLDFDALVCRLTDDLRAAMTGGPKPEPVASTPTPKPATPAQAPTAVPELF